MEGTRTVIIGTGSYLPERTIANRDFGDREFHGADGIRLEPPTEQVISKFEQITGIRERRWVGPELVASDLAAVAAERAIEAAQIDPETLDHVIVAHNVGDVTETGRRTDQVPSLASRVKARLRIRNPRTVGYDVAFGCPGWLQGVIHADCFLRAGVGRRALVIGAETLSRVCDPDDRDSMIYADGAGAVVVEARPPGERGGILAHAARTDAADHAFLLWMGGPYRRNGHPDDGSIYLKMEGHKVYEYAVKTVPEVISECLASAGVAIGEVAKILVHQANAKLDQAIIKRVLRGTGLEAEVESLVPMTVGWLGNTSVATLPTLLDLVRREQLDGHRLASGDVLVFASVGAGMNANAMAYRME
jgi:3-oxoacyl-[acyl-carrier-protein] synthase-3